jgi:hypothetical protein
MRPPIIHASLTFLFYDRGDTKKFNPVNFPVNLARMVADNQGPARGKTFDPAKDSCPGSTIMTTLHRWLGTLVYHISDRLEMTVQIAEGDSMIPTCERSPRDYGGDHETDDTYGKRAVWDEVCLRTNILRTGTVPQMVGDLSEENISTMVNILPLMTIALEDGIMTAGMYQHIPTIHLHLFYVVLDLSSILLLRGFGIPAVDLFTANVSFLVAFIENTDICPSKLYGSGYGRGIPDLKILYIVEALNASIWCNPHLPQSAVDKMEEAFENLAVISKNWLG